jgi:Tol biopolymer transport system component
MASRLTFALLCLVLGTTLLLSFLSRSGSATTVDQRATDTGAERFQSGASLGRLAFVRNGDIWVQEVHGADARRVTDDGVNERPLWSSSGEWIAFWKRSGSRVDLWVTRRSGVDARQIEQLAPPWSGAASWSPREDRLAFIREGSVWILDPDQGTERQIVPAGSRPEEERVTRIAWSPDGRWIAYGWINRPELRPVLQGVFRIQPDARNDAEVFLNPDPFATQSLLAGWSPDGQWILFWEGCCMSASQLAGGPPLMAVPADGGEPVRLSPGVLFRHPDDVMAWSPDGRLALVEGPGREVWEKKAIRVVSSGNQSSMIVSEPDRVDFYPSWSSHGDVLAYSSGPVAEAASAAGDERERALGQRRIWTMRPDGSDKRPMTSDDRYRDERPLWIGAGTHILFARLAGERAQLWLMRGDGSEQQPVVDDLGPIPNELTPVWFGFYGYIDWSRYYDWWQAPAVMQVDPSGDRRSQEDLRPFAARISLRLRQAPTRQLPQLQQRRGAPRGKESRLVPRFPMARP